MIKNIFLSLFFCFLLFSCSNDRINIKGEIEGTDFNGETVFLYAIKPSQFIENPIFLAKTTINQGKFQFNDIQNLDELKDEVLPTIAFVSLFDMLSEDNMDDSSDLPIASLVLEKGEIHLMLKDDGSVTISGTQKNDEFNEIHKAISNLAELIDKKREYDELENIPMDETGRDGVAQYQYLTQQFRDVTFNFAKDNMQNSLGKFIFYSYADNIFSPMQLRTLIEMSDQSFKDMPDIKNLTNILKEMDMGDMPQINSNLSEQN